ncbi:MAG: heparinase II/III family protein [Bacteroidota bacterium]|nr:heparinase II/III family protein [Bacteroidota bacterium]
MMDGRKAEWVFEIECLGCRDGRVQARVKPNCAEAVVPCGYLLVTFDTSGYDMGAHIRYARFAGDETRRTFGQAVFSPAPPGIPVGPWPGWRDIPLLPGVELRTPQGIVRGKWVFWGDETRENVLRAVFAFSVPGESFSADLATDERFVPVSAEFHPFPFPQVHPIDAPLLTPLRGRHPRLLFDARDLPRLRAKATASSPLWARLVDACGFPRGFTPTPEAKIPCGGERLSEHDFLFLMAFRACVGEEEEALRAARESFSQNLVSAQRLDREPFTVDTQCGEALFLLCAAYDFLHPFMDDGERRCAARVLEKIAEHCAAFLTPERDDYAQAHFLGCGLGLLAHSIVFDGEEPAMQRRAALRGVLERIVKMLPDEGFFPHGVNLWIYEHAFLLRWAELFSRCCGVRMWDRTGYWRNASRFRAATASHDGLIGVTFGDPQYRVGGDAWCHDLIALRTGDADAAATADFLRDLPVEGVDFRCAPPRRRVYEFLYGGERLEKMETRIENAEFPDGGQVVLRGSDTVITLRCGAPVGHARRLGGEAGGYGHSDPCNGSILVLTRGEFLLSGPGPVYRRDTALHNVFTVKGSGQLGDGCVWAPDFVPDRHIPEGIEWKRFGSTSALRLDPTAAYLPSLGVERCLRALVVHPEHGLLGVDTITLDAVRNIEWNMHSHGDFRFVTFVPTLRFAIRTACAEAHLAVLPGGPFSWATGRTEFVPAYPHDGVRDRFLKLQCRSASMTVAWRLDFREPAPLELQPTGTGCLRVHAFEGSEFLFDIAAHRFMPYDTAGHV